MRWAFVTQARLAGPSPAPSVFYFPKCSLDRALENQAVKLNLGGGAGGP